MASPYQSVDITKEMILGHYVYLIDNLTASKIVPYYIQSGLLTIDDAEEISKSGSNDNQNTKLIRKMLKCGPDSYKIFRKALIQSRSEFIIAEMQKPGEEPLHRLSLASIDPVKKDNSTQTDPTVCPKCESVYDDASSTNTKWTEGPEHVYESLSQEFAEMQSVSSAGPPALVSSISEERTPPRRSSLTGRTPPMAASGSPSFHHKVMYMRNPLNITGSQHVAKPGEDRYFDFFNKYFRDNGEPGWCPTVRSLEQMTTKISRFSEEAHAYVIWYYSKDKRLVISLVHRSDIQHVKIKEKRSEESPEDTEYYVYSQGIRFTKLPEILRSLQNNGVEIRQQK